MKLIDVIMRIGMVEDASNENGIKTIDELKYFLDGTRIILFVSALKLENTISFLKTDVKKLLNEQQTDYAKEIILNIDSKITGLTILLIANILLIILMTLKKRKIKKGES